MKNSDAKYLKNLINLPSGNSAAVLKNSNVKKNYILNIGYKLIHGIFTKN
jgi:hypothetical protein